MVCRMVCIECDLTCLQKQYLYELSVCRMVCDLSEAISVRVECVGEAISVECV